MTRQATILEQLTRPGGSFPMAKKLIHGISIDAYDREPRTLRDVFLGSDLFGSRPALQYENQVWSFSEQRQIAISLAVALSEKFGVAKGDKVAIAMRNYPEWAFAFWATQLLGAVAVPLNAWATGDELAHLLAHCRPKLVFADQERADRILEAGSDDICMIGVRCRDDGATIAFESLFERQFTPELPACELSADDAATIIYTSGTTGRPKGVVATHFAHTASLLNRFIRVVASVSEATGEIREPAREELPRQTKLMAYPLFHIAGLGTLCAAVFNGHSLVTMYKWDVEKASRTIATEKISELSGPPLIAQQIVEAGRARPELFRSLRSLGAGGASLPSTLLSEIADVFEGRVSPTTGYGLTETTGGVISISGPDFISHPDCIGRPLPTVEVQILDEHGAALPAGQAGELVVRAPQVMSGYYGDDDATKQAIVDGYFHTGDLAVRRADGLIKLVGRLKDIVIRGGENINCGQVEACIGEHSAVYEVAALGTPHPTLGEELVAVVGLHPGRNADETELRAFVAERLAAFKVPARFYFTASPLPRTASGKILKREIAVQELAPGRPESFTKD